MVQLLVLLLNVSKPVLAAMTKVHLRVMMSSHGNVDLPVPQLLGNNEAVGMIVVDTILVMLLLEVLRLGKKIVDVEEMAVAITMLVRTATTRLQLHPLVLLGNKLRLPILPLLPHQADMLATLHPDTARVTIKQAWVHLRGSLLLLD